MRKYNVGVGEIHEAIEKYLANGKLWNYKEKIVFLFDEIHEDPYWARDLKVLYDLFQLGFVVATGSSVLLLQSTADLVTRMLIQHVFPLSFSEYINITKKNAPDITVLQSKLKELLFYSNDAQNLYSGIKNLEPEIYNYYASINISDENILDYIQYHNITRFSFETNKERINLLISDLVKRVIYEDIPKLNKKRIDELNSEKILGRMAASDEINTQTMSQTIGISQKEISETLEILVKAELLNVLRPFGGIDTKINKAQKYFFMSPSIRKVILQPLTGAKYNTETIAKMLEDTVVLYLKRIFRNENIISFSSYKTGKNPDLIIETIPAPIIVEIGINKNTTKQISESNINFKYGVVINSKTEEVGINDNVVTFPIKYFLLL